jgi:hypothetical protein
MIPEEEIFSCEGFGMSNFEMARSGFVNVAFMPTISVAPIIS